jgi:coniferyl-aldehyde dehydrogenase
MEMTIAPTALKENTGNRSAKLSGRNDQSSPRDGMYQVLERQRQAFTSEGRVSAETRMDRLNRIYRMIGKNKQVIVDACQQDFGNRSRHQSQMSEVLAIMDGMRNTIKQVKTWMQPEKRRVTFPMGLLGAKARIEYQPKGVAGILSTWNFPVYTAIMPLAGVFAAGNRAMIKLSEVTPATSLLLQSIIADYFDETELVGITGGPDIGAEFAALPFDHILFTGGTAIGRHILQAAAQNLTPVTLELGGKSPVIISRSCDISKAAQRIMSGKALNMGQACLAPDYCFVPRAQKEAFIAAAIQHFSAMFPSILSNPDYTSVVNARHDQRIRCMIEDAREKGGDVREINPASEKFSSQGEGLHKVPMTLVVEPTETMLVMQEELFGPILCIKTYEDITETISYINARPRPLGLYYFGEDADEERLVLNSTISGGVTLNDVMAHSSCDDLPFGGIGHSGMGSYHGIDGFRTFSHQKAIYKQSSFDPMKLAGMVPPYGRKCQKQLDKLTKLKT